LSQIVLLDVAQLRLRRPIRDNPSGYLRFAALATKPGEISGLDPRKAILTGDLRQSLALQSLELGWAMEN
jgi:hypothetical protein